MGYGICVIDVPAQPPVRVTSLSDVTRYAKLGVIVTKCLLAFCLTGR